MISRSFAAFNLLTLFVVSTIFLTAPQNVNAQAGEAELAGATMAVPTGETPISGLSRTNLISSIKETLIEVQSYADWVNSYILQPAALIKSGNLMKALTSGVITFVTGVSNGTGAPQFVQDLQGSLQKVGDTQYASFLAQFARNSNSPFAPSIISSLRSNYQQNSNMAGFWAGGGRASI